MNMLSVEKITPSVGVRRPSLEEVAHYARMILQHEGRPLSALPDCEREAELQLWAVRSFGDSSGRRSARRHHGLSPA
jgi:hypothetical protein